MLKQLVAICFLCACKHDDLDFEIVKVPLTAYADAGPRKEVDAGAHTDGGHELVVMCFPPTKKESDDTNDDTNEQSSDDCPPKHGERNYDERATTRHRKNSEESDVCCYRYGRVAPPKPDEPGEE